MFIIQGAAVGLTLVASLVSGSDSSNHSARAESAQLVGIPDSAYPAHPPFNPPNIVPIAVRRACRPDSNNPSAGPRPGTPAFVHKPGLKDGPGIIITLGDCAPPTDGVARRSSPEEDAAFINQFKAHFGLEEGSGAETSSNFDPAVKVGRNLHSEHKAPQKRQGQCQYPIHRPCQFLPGGEKLVGYDRCGYECQPICTDSPNGPNADDCDAIFANFDSRIDKSNQGDLVAFSIPQDKFVMFTFNTCATVIHNHIPEARQSAGPGCRADLIYSYMSWAQAGRSMVTNCRKDAANGICRDASSVGVDFYMQMFRFEAL